MRVTRGDLALPPHVETLAIYVVRRALVGGRGGEFGCHHQVVYTLSSSTTFKVNERAQSSCACEERERGANPILVARPK